MAEQNSIPTRSGSQRRLIASGVKRGNGPLITNALSPADIAAHQAASYVRRTAARAA